MDDLGPGRKNSHMKLRNGALFTRKAHINEKILKLSENWKGPNGLNTDDIYSRVFGSREQGH